MRLFVALPVDEAARRSLESAAAPWRPGPDGEPGRADVGWRWSRPEGWHVTLAFLGEMAGEQAELVGRAVRPVVAGAGRIELRLGPLGHFGRRVLHVEVRDRPTGAVADLGREVQVALVGAGLDVRQREVRPHLTLARARRGTRPSVPEFEPPAATWTVDEARLYSSHLGAGGASYEVVERFPLS